VICLVKISEEGDNPQKPRDEFADDMNDLNAMDKDGNK
jgi:hypothetical protein